MPEASPQIIVAGHVCLDVIPTFVQRADPDLREALRSGLEEGAGGNPIRPGALVNVGPAVMATGGAVSNVGLALHRLGVPVRLIGKLGDDLFGDQVIRIFNAASPTLAAGMRRVPGEVTSYSVVINPPGVDRTFLHCPGANDTFTAADVDIASLAGGDAMLLHFGYPPIMRRMFLDGGRELATLLRRVREAGLTVSLDMCMVDAKSEAGRVDWAKLLAGSLPHVDVFCPSCDELLFMLDRPAFDATAGALDASTLATLAERCIELGAAIVAIKLGDQGLYLRTTGDAARLAACGRAAPNVDAWVDRELHAPCFAVDVVGTTGSGDCTIAGLLASLIRRESPEAALRAAVAVGASSVEAADAVSGVSPWPDIERRIAAGWPARSSVIELDPRSAPSR